MNVPSVTPEDLDQFHSLHFPSTARAAPLNHSTQAALEDGDDFLGYYDDGVKRTLTDEQITMFRHSEIQTLVKERRLAAEARAEEKEEARVDIEEMVKEEVKLEAPEASAKAQTAVLKPRQLASIPGSTRRGSENQEEQLDGQPKKKKRKGKRVKTDLQKDISENRLARELDEVQNEIVELDY